MRSTKNQTKAFSLVFWKVLSHSAASGSLTLDGNLKWSLMWVLSSDSRRMSKYKRRKQRSFVLDLHSLLKSLALYIRNWVVLFIFNFLTFYSSLVLREWPSAHSLSLSLSLLGIVSAKWAAFIAGDKCRAASCQRRVWMNVVTRSPSKLGSSLCLHKAQLAVTERSVWYLVLGFLLCAGALHNISLCKERW